MRIPAVGSDQLVIVVKYSEIGDAIAALDFIEDLLQVP